MQSKSYFLGGYPRHEVHAKTEATMAATGTLSCHRFQQENLPILVILLAISLDRL